MLDVSLHEFFAQRQMPRFRFNEAAKQHYGIDSYNAELLCRITHGVMPNDFYWMRFEDDPPDLQWEDVELK